MFMFMCTAAAAAAAATATCTTTTTTTTTTNYYKYDHSHHHLEDGEVHVVLCLRRWPVLGMRRRVDDACGCVGEVVRVSSVAYVCGRVHTLVACG